MNMNIEETTKILNNLHLVNLRIGFPTGIVSAPEGLVADKEKEIVRVGLQVFDPTILRPFSAARQRVKRLCTALGTSFLGGYAIPTEHIAEFRDVFAEIGESYNANKKNFLDNLVEENRRWAETHPELKPIILAKCPSPAEAERSFKFAVSICKVVPAEADGNHLFEEVGGLGAQIAREIAQDVQDSWADTGGRTTQKVVGLIRRCRKKVYGLSFVHPKLGALVTSIDEVLAELPTSGPIQGQQYLKVVGLLRMLSDPNQILGQQIAIPDPEAAPEVAPEAAPEVAPEAAPEVAPEAAPEVAPEAAPGRVAWMF